jgi:DNA-binding NtrC family response regulator
MAYQRPQVEDPAMGILVVSPSPLFKDVLAEILERRDLDLVSITDPSSAAVTVASERHRVVLIDEATESSFVLGILAEVRKLPSCRLIFLAQEGNDMLVLDSRLALIKEVGDFVSAIGVPR